MSRFEFLHSQALSRKISHVLKNGGTAVVAYVGEGAALFLPSSNVEVICDFGSMGTNPYEIERLRKKLGPDAIRQLRGLHAKVYYSNSGAVVSSANISTNGLELVERQPAFLIESGIFVPSGSEAHKRIGRWIAGLKSNPISSAQIAEKKRKWDRMPRFARGQKRQSRNSNQISVNDILKTPEKFIFSFFSAPSNINPSRVKISTKGLPPVSVSKFEESIGANVFMQDDDFYPVRGQAKFSTFAKRLLRSDTVVLSLRLNWPSSANSPQLPKSPKLYISKFRGWGSIPARKTLLTFYKEHGMGSGPETMNKTEFTKLVSLLKEAQKTQLWEKWAAGTDKKEWYGTSLYLSGHGLKKILRGKRRSRQA